MEEFAFGLEFGQEGEFLFFQLEDVLFLGFIDQLETGFYGDDVLDQFYENCKVHLLEEVVVTGHCLGLGKHLVEGVFYALGVDEKTFMQFLYRLEA